MMEIQVLEFLEICKKLLIQFTTRYSYQKLYHYGIRGVSIDQFKSCLSNCNQYLSINGYEFGLAALNCGIPEGSVLGPLLVVLYINDINQAIKVCKVHHFADDTNLLCLSNSIKKLNKLVYANLKYLVNLLNPKKFYSM